MTINRCGLRRQPEPKFKWGQVRPSRSLWLKQLVLVWYVHKLLMRMLRKGRSEGHKGRWAQTDQGREMVREEGRGLMLVQLVHA